jgi:hypothetical protein
VVAELFRWRRQRAVGVCLLCLVLRYSAAYPGLHLEYALLQLQLSGLRGVWAFDGHGWFSYGICIRQASLQVSCFPFALFVSIMSC